MRTPFETLACLSMTRLLVDARGVGCAILDLQRCHHDVQLSIIIIIVIIVEAMAVEDKVCRNLRGRQRPEAVAVAAAVGRSACLRLCCQY